MKIYPVPSASTYVITASAKSKKITVMVTGSKTGYTLAVQDERCHRYGEVNHERVEPRVDLLIDPLRLRLLSLRQAGVS